LNAFKIVSYKIKNVAFSKESNKKVFFSEKISLGTNRVQAKS